MVLPSSHPSSLSTIPLPQVAAPAVPPSPLSNVAGMVAPPAPPAPPMLTSLGKEASTLALPSRMDETVAPPAPPVELAEGVVPPEPPTVASAGKDVLPPDPPVGVDGIVPPPAPPGLLTSLVVPPAPASEVIPPCPPTPPGVAHPSPPRPLASTVFGRSLLQPSRMRRVRQATAMGSLARIIGIVALFCCNSNAPTLTFVFGSAVSPDLVLCSLMMRSPTRSSPICPAGREDR
jgi:hypothetical protein